MTAKRNIWAFFVISILGTLGHFVYEWSGKPYLVGLFFPVNESTWEHLKLLFFPAVIYSAVEYLTLKEKPKNYITATAISVIIGMLSIIVMFYTYQGVIGRNIDILNILIYYMGVIVTVFAEQKIIKRGVFSSEFLNIIFLAIIFLTAVLFVFFSYNPPALGIFLPPAV